MFKYKVNIGDIELISLTDGQGSGEATEIFPTSNLDIWESEYKDLLDGKVIHPRFGSFIICLNGRLIIVDTGVPLNSMSLNGDHLHLLSILLFLIVIFLFISTIVKSAS